MGKKTDPSAFGLILVFPCGLRTLIFLFSVTQKIEKLQIKDGASQNSDEEILTEEINLSGRKIPSPMSDDQQMLVRI